MSIQQKQISLFKNCGYYMISGLLILVFSLPSFASTSALLLTATKTPVESGFMLNNSKSASASLFSFFWLISLGDASIEKLTKEAGFTRVHHIDKETRSFLFLFQEEKTTVYGE